MIHYKDWSLIQLKHLAIAPLLVEEPPLERGKFGYDKNGRMENLSEEGQVPNSLARYNHLKYKELYKGVQSKIETILGEKLYPTYYFDRIYYSGQELVPHTDWEGCEVSGTLQIETTLKSAWDFYVEGTPIKMEDGDAVIYNGMFAKHWRKPMEGNSKDYHHQIFLHYVIHNSPCYFTMLENKWELND